MLILKAIILTIYLLTFIDTLPAQSYTSWMVGNHTDLDVKPVFGIVLAGGGKDNDEAMRWMLKQANGGDVVVIRASGSDGYNAYFFSELGVPVHSVETLLIKSKEAANDSYVEQQIKNAEVLFIAGGDQYNYYQYWKDTKVEDAINHLLHEKKATVGGTSAGMAILGKIYYTPHQNGITTTEALQNPYHPNMSILGKDDFINAPFLENLVTDTHYDNRNRAGRHFTFLARINQDWNIKGRGIACNEHTTVCIDSLGKAMVFGSDADDLAYFLQTENSPPEICTAGQKLTWYQNRKAIKVYQIMGSPMGANWFSLKDWQNGTGGVWQDWFVKDGLLNEITTGENEIFFEKKLKIFPNPSEGWVDLSIENVSDNLLYLELFNAKGEKIIEQQAKDSTRLNLSVFPKGVYQLRIRLDTFTTVRKVVKL